MLAQSNTTFDRAHSKEFGGSALTFEVVCNMNNPDYNTYMDTHQTINLGLFKHFKEEEIGFDYPTRTLHIVKEPEAEATAVPLPNNIEGLPSVFAGFPYSRPFSTIPSTWKATT